MGDFKRARFKNHAIQARAFNTQGGAGFKSMGFTYLIKFQDIPRPVKSMSFELRDVAMKRLECLLKRPKFKKSNKRGLSRAKSTRWHMFLYFNRTKSTGPAFIVPKPSIY
jgi:hypothetical protein